MCLLFLVGWSNSYLPLYSLENYLRCLNFLESNFAYSPCIDQGILSLMVFKVMDDRLNTAKEAHFQTPIPVEPQWNSCAAFVFAKTPLSCRIGKR